MSEEIERRISEIEVSLHLLGRVKKHIIDVELPDARKEFYAAKFEQDKLFEISERELTDIDRDLLKKLRKEVPELRSYYRKLREDLDGYIERSDKLEEEKKEREERLDELELERLKEEERLWLEEEIPPPVEIPQFIDIDDATGYLIFFSRDNNAYFLVRQEDYKEGKIEAVKYFSTLEIAVNFTFDTEAVSKYPDLPPRTLEAEVRIVARVRGAGRELSIAIPEKLKEAFERHITFFFEQSYDRGKGAGTWKGGMTHIIADGVNYNGKHKIDVGKAISDMLGVKVLKVGLFYRINDEKVNFIVEEEYARPVVTGEWSRQNYSESISQEFNVEYELGQPLHWSMVRGFCEETGWEQLKRIKEEER